MAETNAEALARIIAEMSGGMANSQRAKQISEKLASGSATYADALEYARETGRVMTGSMKKHLPEVLTDGKLYRATAETVIKKPMQESASQVIDMAAEIQESLNQAAEIGIHAIRPDINQDQIDGIITGICNAESYESGRGLLFDQIENFLEGTVDDCVRENAEFHYQAGLSPTIERRADAKCCLWCSALAGVYDYADVRDKGNDVYRRHNNCHCQVLYNPGDGSKRRQNAHTKKWTYDNRDDRIRRSEQPGPISKPPEQRELEAAFRRQAGSQTNTLAAEIRRNPKALRNYTPETMFDFLTEAGYQPAPLSRGNLKGVSFKDGGGYKINFGGDGEFQYHPQRGTHHGEAYWKIADGKGGISRYDINGNEL